MQDAIIYLDPENSMSLQNQIRQKLVDGILNGDETGVDCGGESGGSWGR